MFKKLSKDIFVYGCSEIIVNLLAIVTVPIYTRVFNPDDYGIISLVTAIISVLNIFLNLGMDNAVSRYFFEAKPGRERSELISTGFYFIVCWSILVMGAMSFFSRQFSLISFKSPDYTLLFQLAWAASLLGMVISFSKNIVRFYYKPWEFTTIAVCEGIFIFFFSLMFVVWLKMGLKGFFLGMVTGYVLATLPSIWFIRHDLKRYFSINLAKNLLKYGIPFVPAGIAFWIFNLSDRFIIPKLTNLEQLGLYSIAVKLTIGLLFLNRILGRAWSPRAFELYKNNDSHKIIFGQMLTYILVVFSYAAIGLTILGPEILKIFTTPKYYGAVYAICPLSLGLVAYSTNQITMLGINLSGKTKYVSYCSWLAALVNIGLNFLLIPKFGMVGAAYATMVSYILLTVTLGFISQKLYPINFEAKKIAKIMVIISFFVFASFQIENLRLSRTEAALLIKLFCLLLFPIMLFLAGVLGKKEMYFMQETFTGLKNRVFPVPAK